MTLPTTKREMDARERAKPVELVAESAEDAGMAWMEANDRGGDSLGWADVPFEVYARAALACLVSHGFITIEGLLAMKAEQEAKPSDTAQTDTRNGNEK
jgi:hypothetical protein